MPALPIPHAGPQSTTNGVAQLRRGQSAERAYLGQSRRINTRSSSTDPASRSHGGHPPAHGKAMLLRESSDGGPTSADGFIGDSTHDVFFSRFGNSSTSLVSRAPTFASSSSAFTDESSLRNTDVTLPRRRSSTGSLGKQTRPPAAIDVASSLPSSTSIKGAFSGPFSDLVPVPDVVLRPRRSPSTSRKGACAAKSPSTPSFNPTLSAAELPPPARKLQRKPSPASRTPSSSSRADFSTHSSPYEPIPPRQERAPRPSLSCRPSFSATRCPSPSIGDGLPVPPLSPYDRPPSRSRSKTVTSRRGEDEEGSSSRTGTLRGGFLKLKKSTASLRSAFRSPRLDPSVPPTPPLPPLPPAPEPMLRARPATNQDESVKQFLAALQRSQDGSEAENRQRASTSIRPAELDHSMSSASRRSASTRLASPDTPQGFSFSPTTSSSPLPPLSTPSSPRRPRSRPRTATTQAGSPKAGEASGRRRRSASVGGAGSIARRPEPPLPRRLERLEMQRAPASVALALSPR
ncbi:hypothetical protein JCM10207_002269 [Rhodosporidiobolus poonsookiae]